MSKCGERVWHHAWYTGDAQCMSLAVLCPSHPLFKEGELWGKLTHKLCPQKAGRGGLPPAGMFVQGQGNKDKAISLWTACGLHAMSLNLWLPVFSYTGPLLGAAEVFSSPREPSCVWGIIMVRFSCRQEQPRDTVLAQEMEVRVLMG